MAKEPELLENKIQAFSLSMHSESQKRLCQQLGLHYWKHSMLHGGQNAHISGLL